MGRTLGTMMMSEYSLYGALEIKRCYQKNLVMGVLLAATVHLMAVGGVAVYRNLATEVITVPAIRIISGPRDFDPPPRMTEAPPQTRVTAPEIAPPVPGIPTPVPDDEVSSEVNFPTRDQMAALTNPAVPPTDGTGNQEVIVAPPADESEYFPKTGEFVPVETFPVRIDQTQLVYPEMAALTGTEGVVVIEALVDREGKVREVRVVKPSGSNVGFEQAALDFSSKHLYKPAIQNGRPVAVRITFRVEFRLGQR